MNNDEFPDLLVPNTDDHTLMFFEGNGDGSFKKPFVMNTGREPVALAVADFNGDRIPDAAVCNYGDGNLSIILGQKDGVFKILEPVKTGKLPIAITTGDFNNDRKADLAVTLRFDKLIIFLGNGDGTFKQAEAYIAPGTPARLVAGDYNGDNNQDLAITFNCDEDQLHPHLQRQRGRHLPTTEESLRRQAGQLHHPERYERRRPSGPDHLQCDGRQPDPVSGRRQRQISKDRKILPRKRDRDTSCRVSLPVTRYRT